MMQAPVSTMEKTGWGARLRAVREMRKLSQRKFAEALEVTQPTIARYEEEGRDPDIGFLVKLRAVYGVDPTWVVTGEGLSPLDETESHGTGDIPHRASWLARQDKLHGRVRLAEYGPRPAAGSGTESEEDWVTGAVDLSDEEQERYGDPRRYAAARVRGRSMEPNLHDGDLVFVDKTTATDRTDGVYVLLDDGDLKVKTLVFSGDRLHVVSDNSDFPSHWLEGERLERVRIIGRVVYVKGAR